MSQPIRWQGGHIGFFFINPKNTNLVEDVEILHSVKFRWIQFSGFREEVENVSANQRPGRPSCFYNRPKEHKLGRGRCDLASFQDSLHSVQRLQRRSRKCEKLTTDGRRTTCDHNSALEPSAQVHLKVIFSIKIKVNVTDLDITWKGIISGVYCKIINFRGTFNFVYFVGKESPRKLMSAKLFISYIFAIFYWKSTKLNVHQFVTNLKSTKF